MKNRIKSSIKNNKNNNEKNIDYNTYVMPAGEKLLNIIKVLPAIYLLGFLFYKNHLLSALLCIGALFYPRLKVKAIIRKRKEELNIQFKDMLYSLKSSLWAGRPVELAFGEVSKDLCILYPDPSTPIIMESSLLVKKLEMNNTVESAFSNFAERSGIDDIKDFAEVLKICKRTGGNLVEVVKRTSAIISDRIEMEQDINTMLAQRNLERKVLNIMPVIILALISTTAAEYMSPVYNTAAGRIVMTAAALLLAAAYYLSRKIMDIRI